MSNERSLNQELLRIKRENASLRAKIAELELHVPKQPEQPKQPESPASAKSFDPYSFSDPVVAALSALARLKRRRSWLE
jgi:hypothetical protein